MLLVARKEYYNIIQKFSTNFLLLVSFIIFYYLLGLTLIFFSLHSYDLYVNKIRVFCFLRFLSAAKEFGSNPDFSEGCGI